MTQLPAIWPATDLIIFDCDSTLTAVEGIDELARLTDSVEDVAALTKRAMDGEIPLESVYSHRLDISNPTRAQVNHIRRIYRQHVIPGAAKLIEALQELNCKVFIVSGGLIEPVRDFGVWLGVPRENIYAVDMEYDQLAGQWWRYWEQPGGHNPQANYLNVRESPLTGTGGKNLMIRAIRANHAGRAMLVGDGLSDLEARSEVELFVGFGGAAYRERVARESPLYIQRGGLAALLPLALGRLASRRGQVWASLYTEGLAQIEQGDVLFNDLEMQKHFADAVLHVQNRHF
ncbi:MAG: HAD-IB family phosphatase [Chloroflexi bacterium]|nr:HAD-IB family phosphatase [Chloroflexota bacterium]